MTAAHIGTTASSISPSVPRKDRTSASASASASSDSSCDTTAFTRSRSSMPSIMRCFPNRRQRKLKPSSSSTTSDQQTVGLCQPLEGPALTAPIPFPDRHSTRPSDLNCSLFSLQSKDGPLTISVPLSPPQPQGLPHTTTTPTGSPLVPLCVDIFTQHTSSGVHYVSPNASALCAHETIPTKITAPRSPDDKNNTTPIAELAMEMHTSMTTQEIHDTSQGTSGEDAASSRTHSPTQAPPPMSPLPAYMDPIEDLEIRDNITIQSRDDITAFTALLSDSSAWKDVGTKNGVKVAKKEVGHGKPALVKGTVQFKVKGANAEDVIQFFWSTNPMLYNDTVEASFRLRTWSEQLCVFYQSYKGAMGAQGRDFVLYGSRHASEDKQSSVFVSRSCEWQKTPEMLHPRVRAQCYIGGMICSVVSPGVLELTQIWQADLCGSLPDMVKRMVAVSSVGSLTPATRLFAKTFTV